jgi:hypothetical protein
MSKIAAQKIKNDLIRLHSDADKLLAAARRYALKEYR